MQILLKPFYEVMYKYQKCFSEHGVMANLARWRQNKGFLLSLLRNHPGWVEEELAIVYRAEERRIIDRSVVNQHRDSLLALAVELSQDNYLEFRTALTAATDECSAFLSEGNAEIIKECSGVKCVPGQKASRVINRLCKKYRIDNFLCFNSVYAQLANSLSPVHLTKKAVLSVNPCDYLEMSNKDNSWSSCAMCASIAGRRFCERTAIPA